MKKIFALLIIAILVVSCNPTLTTFTFIYNDEGPNREIALRMEELLESSFYNVDIKLIEGRYYSAYDSQYKYYSAIEA